MEKALIGLNNISFRAGLRVPRRATGNKEAKT
jgi:hypothetical protein